MTEETRYFYDIGQKVLDRHYPNVSKQGGVIDYVDCGELHNLFADFQKEIMKELTCTAVKELKELGRK